MWNAWVQPKESFFAWEATWGKALTLDQIQRKRWSLTNQCFLCHAHEKSFDHILLHYGKASVGAIVLSFQSLLGDAVHY